MYLNCHSSFSLRYGTLPPDGLVHQAKKFGVKTLCLTDINNTSALCDFVRACQKEDIKPVWGIEFRGEAHEPLWIGIAKNNQGVLTLNQFLTRHSFTKEPLNGAPESDHIFVIYPFSLAKAVNLKPNEFIGICWHELPKLYGSVWKHHPEKLVGIHPVTFANKEGYHTHQLLRAIDQNTLLSKLDTRHIAHFSERFVPEERLLEKFAEYPMLVFNAQRILEECTLSLDLDAPKNKKYFLGSQEYDRLKLEALAVTGFEDRYGKENKLARERLSNELRIIGELNFTTYFLITHDIVSYAHRKGYRHVGRGSGANSIVAYCLKLTDVDPIKLDLYFERFINPYRGGSPPDFDMDFCWDERDDVTAYIFRAYGKDHVALLATYATFQGNAIVRELGKVYGLPKRDIDVLVEEPKAVHKHHSLADDIYKYGKKLIDFPNHLSIHAGGVLITEEPICQYTALELMPKGFPVTHFDMYVAEDNGFYKYDILSQRGLGHIKEAVKHIRENQHVSVDIDRVNDFQQDPEINKRLASADTVGCFYIESPAMRGLLTKLKCDNYLTLVAASSVIRPGVAKSGMMKEFIQRHHHPGQVQYLHETFRQHLGETYGVMVYQEDVIKIAHHFGGLDLGQADVLRRVMSGKSRGNKILQLEEEYFKNCEAKGYPEKQAREVWRQIESFAGFSFCKAHSASFAVESYQSLYLKTYFPLEFMVGVINNFGGFYNTELYVHTARMAGGDIQAPCVNHSEHLTSINGKTIYLGWVHLKDLERGVAETMVTERKMNGPFSCMEDLILRTGIKKEQLSILIRIRALRFTGRTKQELLWDSGLYRKSTSIAAGSERLFSGGDEHLMLPPLEIHPMEEIFDQMDLLGFPLCSPFEMLKTRFRGDVFAKSMIQHVGKTVRMVGYYICQKNVRTSNRTPMAFGTWIDADGFFFDTIHFSPGLEQYPFNGKGCYLMKGKIVEDFDFPGMEVERMEKLEIMMYS